jgi:CheY-like chemotaxis protein
MVMMLDDQSLPSDPLMAPGPAPEPGTRVLIVSDDALLPARLSRSMAQAGCSVTAVTDAGEALALLRIGYRPGLLVLDDRVPPPERAILRMSLERAGERGGPTVLAASEALRS